MVIECWPNTVFGWIADWCGHMRDKPRCTSYAVRLFGQGGIGELIQWYPVDVVSNPFPVEMTHA
jgi:hypothetical protein